MELCLFDAKRRSARSRGSRCRSAPTRSGTAICRTRGRDCFTAIASTALTIPETAHRFNPHKLLIDPYARALDRPFVWNDLHCGYVVGDARGDLSFDTRDNAALMPKCRVVDPAFDWEGDRHPQTVGRRYRHL